MFFAIFSIRVARKEQYSVPITTINKNEINDFIKNNQRSVIFSLDGQNQIKQVSKVIQAHSKDVNFAVVYNDSLDFCLTTPCASSFYKGKHVRSTFSDFSPLNFEFWLKYSLFEQEITQPESIRRALLLPGKVYFDVQANDKLDDKILHHVSPVIFKMLGINVNSGIYKYRECERELTLQKDKFKTLLFDIGYDSFSDGKYFVGVFPGYEPTKSTIRTLRRVASLYKDLGFKVALLLDAEAQAISEKYGTSHICGPLLVIIGPNKERFVFNGDAIMSENYIIEKITYILNGGKPEPLSLPSDEKVILGMPNQLSLNDFNWKVKNANLTSIIFMFNSCYKTPQEFRDLVKVGSQVYKMKGIQFFVFDQGRQDLIENVPLFETYPQILGYTKDGSMSLYQKDLSLEDFVEFVDELTHGESKLTKEEILLFGAKLMSESSSHRKKRAYNYKSEL